MQFEIFQIFWNFSNVRSLRNPWEMEHCSKDYGTKFDKFFKPFLCHTYSLHDGNLKVFLIQNKMRQPISKLPGRTRDLRISVAVAVAWMTQTRDLSRASWPWSPHSLSWRSYLRFANKIMKLIRGRLQHQLFKVWDGNCTVCPLRFEHRPTTGMMEASRCHLAMG